MKMVNFHALKIYRMAPTSKWKGAKLLELMITRRRRLGTFAHSPSQEGNVIVRPFICTVS